MAFESNNIYCNELFISHQAITACFDAVDFLRLGLNDFKADIHINLWQHLYASSCCDILLLLVQTRIFIGVFVVGGYEDNHTT